MVVGSGALLGDLATANKGRNNLGHFFAGRGIENLSSDPCVRAYRSARRQGALYLNGFARSRLGCLISHRGCDLPERSGIT